MTMPGLTGSERQNLQSAIGSLTRAVRLEEDRQQVKALHHYCQGLELLVPLLASPRCSGQFRSVARQKCFLYLTRTRQLTDLLRNRDVTDDACAEEEEEVGAGAQADGEANPGVGGVLQEVETVETLVAQFFSEEEMKELLGTTKRQKDEEALSHRRLLVKQALDVILSTGSREAGDGDSWVSWLGV